MIKKNICNIKVAPEVCIYRLIKNYKGFKKNYTSKINKYLFILLFSQFYDSLFIGFIVYI